MNTFSAYDEMFVPYDDYRGPYLEQHQELKEDKRVLISIYDAMKRRLEVADTLFSDEKVRNAWMRESFDTRDAIIHGPERKTKLVLDAFEKLDVSKAQIQYGIISLKPEYWDLFTDQDTLELSKKDMEILNKTIYDARSSRKSEVWQFVARSNKVLDSYVGLLAERFGNDCGIMNIRFPFDSVDNLVKGLTIRPLHLRHFEVVGSGTALTFCSSIGKNNLLIGMAFLEHEVFLSQFRELGQGRVPPEKWGKYLEDVKNFYQRWFDNQKPY